MHGAGNHGHPALPQAPGGARALLPPGAVAAADADARPTELPARLLAEIRAEVPRDPAGRRRKAARRARAAADGG